MLVFLFENLDKKSFIVYGMRRLNVDGGFWLIITIYI